MNWFISDTTRGLTNNFPVKGRDFRLCCTGKYRLQAYVAEKINTTESTLYISIGSRIMLWEKWRKEKKVSLRDYGFK